MKAADVLKRYAKGYRDFRGEDLKKQNFNGKDLSGADFTGANFSGASIRGTNFSKTILCDANFSNIKAGITFRQLISWWFYPVILSVLSACTCGLLFIFIFIDRIFEADLASIDSSEN